MSAKKAFPGSETDFNLVAGKNRGHLFHNEGFVVMAIIFLEQSVLKINELVATPGF